MVSINGEAVFAQFLNHPVHNTPDILASKRQIEKMPIYLSDYLDLEASLENVYKAILAFRMASMADNWVQDVAENLDGRYYYIVVHEGWGENGEDIEEQIPLYVKREEMVETVQTEIDWLSGILKNPDVLPELSYKSATIGEMVAEEPWIIFVNPAWEN